MAVPTVTSVTPTSGPTRGRGVVRIDGTNFRLPDPPPATGYLGGSYPLSVEVEFGGEVSPEAQAATADFIYATVPEWRGDPDDLPEALDVTVRNVDASGVPIPTEEATLVGGYTVEHPELPQMTYFQRTILQLMNLFKRHVIANVHVTVKRDYVADPGQLERLQAELPVLHLVGPQTPLNRFYSINREPAEEDTGLADAYLRKAVPVTVDVGFQIEVWAETQREVYSIGQAILLMFRDVVHLQVERDPSQPALGSVEYEVGMPFFGYPTYNTDANKDDLTSLRAQCEIKGVHLDDEAGTIVERGWEITANDGDPTVETQAIEP